MNLPKYILEALRLALLHCEECEALTYCADGYEYVLKTARAGRPWPVEMIVQVRIRTPHGVLIRKNCESLGDMIDFLQEKPL